MSNNRGAIALRAWMTQTKTTQVELSELVSASQQAISGWLKGRTPKLAAALAIREATGIPVESWSQFVKEVRYVRAS